MVRHLLYVEDNPPDATLAREALKDIGAEIEVHVVENGVQAFEFLSRRGRYRNAPAPDLILLDLKLPVMSGMSILVELRRDPIWARVPVVIYTSSKAHSDRAVAHKLGASFEVKPATWPEAIALAERLRAHFAHGARGAEAGPAGRGATSAR
jgi:CheY-like chemotaxis protein